MRVMYRTGFNVGKHGDHVPLESIIRDIHCWKDKFSHVPQNEFMEGTSASEGSRHTETVRSKDGFGVRHVERDSKMHEILWRTDIAVDVIEGRPNFNLELAKAWSNTIIAPLGEVVSRPTIVKDVISKYPCYNGMKLSVEPLRITHKEDVDKFMQLIDTEKRNVPLIYISRTDERGYVLADPNRMASRLAGLGVVCVPSHCASFDLDHEFAKRNGKFGRCYNGAARVFWPRKDRTIPAYDAIFFPERVSDPKFPDEILAFLAQYSVYMPPRKTFQEIRAAGLREKIGGHDAETAELIELYRQERNDAQSNMQSLQLSMKEKDNELFNLRSRLEMLQGALSRKAAPTGRKVSSCLEAFAYASELPGLIIHPRAEDQAKRSLYENPQEIYQVLEWISRASTGQIQGDLRVSARNDLGLEYALNQEDSTMKAHQDEYSVVHNEQRIWLPRHLKKGNGRDPRFTFRLAWGDFADKVIVGYFGQHQRNRHSK